MQQLRRAKDIAIRGAILTLELYRTQKLIDTITPEFIKEEVRIGWCSADEYKPKARC